MDRQIWTSGKIHNFLCPNCNNTLKLEGYQERETENFNNTRFCTFISFLKCNHCNSYYRIFGDRDIHRVGGYYVDNDGHEQFHEEEIDHYTVKCISPPINIIPIHKEYPKLMKEILKLSFLLFWVDISSCANKIRIAIEILLNDRNIKKTITNRMGKRVKLSLHKRIEHCPDDKVKSLLLAIKWIGNDGSHNNDHLEIDDVLDAYQFIDKVLDILYIKSDEQLLSKSKLINKMKKPIGKKTK